MDSIDKLLDHFMKHPVVSIDSRKITPGCIFFALKGEIHDGNIFAAEAIKHGASLAVVSDPDLSGHPGCLCVNDTLIALQELALRYRRSLKAKFLAITGSNGKTTSKELIQRVLSSHFTAQATQGNLNNHIGVPLTILALSPKTEFAVIEMGANHQGEIEQLCKIALPHYGLITNIGKAHLEGFGGIHGVIQAKTELYRFIQEKKGMLFVNADNELLMGLSSGINRFTYGTGKEADCKGRIRRQVPYLEIEWSHPGKNVEIPTNIYGAYNLENILSAIAVGEYFNVPPEALTRAIKSYEPSNNRSQVITSAKDNHIVLDAYNANPTSMEAALVSFASFPSENKMVILGEMLEVGDDSTKEHQELIGLVEQLGLEKVLLAGAIFSSLDIPETWYRFLDAGQLMDWLSLNNVTGHSILIKGSRKIGLEKILEAL